MDYSSKCRCGKVGVALAIPRAIESLEPRECDCDFCRSHELVYLSDPDGELFIEADGGLEPLKQGSEQAVFWQCASCQQIVAVTCEFGDQVKGAVNGNLLALAEHLSSPVTVSPRLLSPDNKRERWASIWMSVSFSERQAAGHTQSKF